MGFRKYFFSTLILFFIACQSCKLDQYTEKISKNDTPNSAIKFANKVTDENVSVHAYDLFTSNYPDVQMLFETEELASFSSYSYKLSPTCPKPMNYEDCLLFEATYKNLKSAENVFQEIKANSHIRKSEVAGMAGIFYEQVQVFERIRKTGGMIAQKGKSIFFLVKSCKEPPIGENWKDYENLFLEFITEKNEEIEVLNADCRMGDLKVQIIIN